MDLIGCPVVEVGGSDCVLEGRGVTESDTSSVPIQPLRTVQTLIQLGEVRRAHQVAEKIESLVERCRALALVAEAMAQSGEIDLAEFLADGVVQTSRSGGDDIEIDWALADCAGTFAMIGRVGKALTTAASIPDRSPYWKDAAVRKLATAFVNTGRVEALDPLLALAVEIAVPVSRVVAFRHLAEAFANTNQGDRAIRVAEVALDLGLSLSGEADISDEATKLIALLRRLGQTERADEALDRLRSRVARSSGAPDEAIRTDTEVSRGPTKAAHLEPELVPDIAAEEPDAHVAEHLRDATQSQSATLPATEPIEPSAQQIRDMAPSADAVPTHADSPASTDQLGREAFAQALAERLRRLHAEDPHSSFMLQIHGPWGAGKTSLLGFLARELAQDRPGDAQAKWIVVHFNAWQHQRIAPPW